MASFRAYIRVSTKEQGLSYSPATQREKLVQAAHRLSLPYVHYEDHFTGKSFNRTDFNRLRDDLRPGDVIGVRDAKRLGRNLREGVEFIHEIVELGIPKLYVKNRLYDLKNYRDKHDLYEDLNDAEYDLEERREISQEGIKKKQDLGEWVFSPRLMGYDLDKNGNVHVNEREATVIRRMAVQYIGGDSFRKIALDLNSGDIPTRQRVPWTATTVRRMLLNPIFCGRYWPRKRWEKKGVEDGLKNSLDELIPSKKYEPIFDFDTYKQILGSYRGVTRTHARQFGYRYRSYLLTGLIKCKNCESLGKNVRYVHAYHKSAAKSGRVNSNYTSRLHVKGCKNEFKTLRESVFNYLIGNIFLLVFLDPSELGSFIENELSKIRETLVHSLEIREADVAELERVKKRLSKVKGRLAELEEEIETEEDTQRVEDFKSLQRDLVLRRGDLNRQLRELSSKGTTIEISDSSTEGSELFSFEWSDLEEKTKDEIVQSMLDEAAQRMTERFGKDNLVSFVQQGHDGEKRDILIKFVKEIGVNGSMFSVRFKNGLEFDTKLFPNKGRNIQNTFEILSSKDGKHRGTFVIDSERQKVELKAPKLSGDYFKDAWYHSLRDDLKKLMKKVSKYQGQANPTTSVTKGR